MGAFLYRKALIRSIIKTSRSSLHFIIRQIGNWSASLSGFSVPQGLFRPARCIPDLLFCSTGIISTGWMHLYLVLLCRRDYFGRPDTSHYWKAIAKNISARPFCQLQVCRASPTIVPGCTPLAWLNVKRCTPYRKRKKMHPLWQINTFLWIVIPECRGSLLPGIWLRFDYVSLPQFVTICRVLQISVTFLKCTPCQGHKRF